MVKKKLKIFGQDDCGIFVFQYSFASQWWKLEEKYAKYLYFLKCNLCRVLKTIQIHTVDKCDNYYFIKFAAQIAGNKI